MREIRILMERLWICKESQKELYYKVKHEIPAFQKFLREQVGWRLINTEHLLKLEKIPAHAESFMGIQEFTDISDYCYLCAVLMFLEDMEDQSQFLLSELIDYLEAQLKDVMEIDWTSFTRRKSLVRTLQFMERNEMIRVYEGATEEFSQERGNEVLYENTGYSKYFATTFLRDISNITAPEDFEKLPLDEIDADRGQLRVNRVYRQLLVCPFLYWESNDDADSLYLKNQRYWVGRYMGEYLGGRLDIHKHIAFWMVSEDDPYGKVYPRDAMLPEAVLLVCTEIQKRIQSGEWTRTENESVWILERELDELIRGCHNRYKEAWSKEYRELAVEKAIETIKGYMRNWMMYKKAGDRICILPVVGKAAGFYPSDWKG